MVHSLNHQAPEHSRRALQLEQGGQHTIGLCQNNCTDRQAGPGRAIGMPRPRKPASLFRCFNSSPEVIRLVVMIYVRLPSLTLTLDQQLDGFSGC
jgi:hypothetical protein